MNIRDRQSLKQTAVSQLSRAAYSPRRLMLLHTGVSLGASFAVTVLNLILDGAIATTGGLSGITTRAILSTLQSVLQLAVTVLLPFWQIGIIYVSTRLARGESAQPGDLTRGFHRIGSILLMNFLRATVLSLLVMPCIYLSSLLFSLTPFANSAMAEFMPVVEQINTTGVVDEATMTAMLQAMTPMLILSGVVYLAFAIPVMYLMRQADYILMDEPRMSPVAALLTSVKMTRRNGFALFRLDLSFWWFYGLQALLAILAYGETVLSLIGVTLPIDAGVAYLVFYILYILGMLALYGHSGMYVQTTYALAYEALRPQPKEE